jgi:hypothetical protein
VSDGADTLGDQRLSAGSPSWSSFEDITGSDPNATAGPPQLAVAVDGSGVLTFAYGQPGATAAEAVTRSSPGGAWSAPIAVGPPGSDSNPVAAGVSPQDVAYILLDEQPSGGEDCAGVVKLPPGAGASSPTCLSATGIGPPLTGDVAFIGADAYFAWSGPNSTSGGDVVEGAGWSAQASSPSGATDLVTAAPGLALSGLLPDGDGSVAAFWTGGPGGGLDVAAFDAGGPELVAAQVPSRALVGEDFGMNVTFADLWSGVGAPPAWSFGDGTAGAGTQVAHAYAQAGTYPVTVTATDRLGNPTTARFSIVVTSPPPPPPPPPPRAPRLTNVSQTRARWRESSGTTFSLTLSEPARVSLRFTRRQGSHRLTAGTLSRQLAAGRTRLHFDGRLPGGRVLATGAYSVAITASAHRRSSRTATLSFFILVP